jgi:hypothetical protein
VVFTLVLTQEDAWCELIHSVRPRQAALLIAILTGVVDTPGDDEGAAGERLLDDLWQIAPDKTWLSLKWNNSITNDRCAICGRRCDPTGFDFFLCDTWELVCDDCAIRNATPEQLEERENTNIESLMRSGA